MFGPLGCRTSFNPISVPHYFIVPAYPARLLARPPSYPSAALFAFTGVFMRYTMPSTLRADLLHRPERKHSHRPYRRITSRECLSVRPSPPSLPCVCSGTMEASDALPQRAAIPNAAISAGGRCIFVSWCALRFYFSFPRAISLCNLPLRPAIIFGFRTGTKAGRRHLQMLAHFWTFRFCEDVPFNGSHL